MLWLKVSLCASEVLAQYHQRWKKFKQRNRKGFHREML